MSSQTRKIKKIPEINENENILKKIGHLRKKTNMLKRANSLEEISEEEFEKFFKDIGEVWNPNKKNQKKKRKTRRRSNRRKNI